MLFNLAWNTNRALDKRCLEREKISHAKAQRRKAPPCSLGLLCVFAPLRENWLRLKVGQTMTVAWPDLSIVTEPGYAEVDSATDERG